MKGETFFWSSRYMLMIYCCLLFGRISKLIAKEFEMSMILNFFLVLQIKQCQHGIFIHHGTSIKELLKKYNFDSSKPARISMASNCNFDFDTCGKAILEKLCCDMIRSLLCLTNSILGILFCVCLYARLQSLP